MTVSDQLSELRADFPSCEIAAFADLSSGMILSVSADKKLPQELLDAFCAEAVSALGETEASDSLPAVAVRATPQGFLVFLRATSYAAEALCLRCGLGIDLRTFTDAARARLSRMEQDA
ncbi:MAG: hypothetical protein AAF667_04735 [Pseudomonadota bacterium]